MGDYDKVNSLVLRQEIIITLSELISLYPEEYDLSKVADGLIAKVRAYLIDEGAELPENPQTEHYYAVLIGDDLSLAAVTAREAFSDGQQFMLAAGFRKVRKEGG